MANKALQQYDQELASIYAPQEQLIQQQYEATLPQFEAQAASLQQAKINAFRDIGDTAQRRGMYFSGFQPTEQARFIGEKFLPGLAQVEQGKQQAQLGMLEALTGLGTKRAESRLNFRETLRQEALQRALDKKQYQRQMKMQKQSQQFQASQSALDRSFSSASSGGGSKYSFTQAQNDYDIELDKHKGTKDKLVSPGTWNRLRKAWVADGFSPSQFDKKFKAYLPPKGKRRKNYKT